MLQVGEMRVPCSREGLGRQPSGSQNAGLPGLLWSCHLLGEGRQGALKDCFRKVKVAGLVSEEAGVLSVRGHSELLPGWPWWAAGRGWLGSRR